MKLSFLAAFPFSLGFLFFSMPKDEAENGIKNTSSSLSQKISGGLFDSDEILNIKLSGSIRSLFNDRGDNAPYRPLVLTYKGSDSNTVTISIRGKTRGNF